jgi:long-chain acyl-CoA synthetase
LPLYHIFALTVNCMGLFKQGMTNVLITNPRDIPNLIKELASCRPSVITAVNTLLAALLQNQNFKNLRMDRLKLTVAGGMALKGAVAEEWTSVTKTPVLEGYGLTECSPVVCCNPLSEKAKLGTIGLPLPSTQVKCIGEDGEELSQGQVGELCVSGPQVMKGYYNQTQETQNVLLPNGWLKTGDIAQIDPEGFVQLVDRKKDMVLVSGFNVFPNEVEEVAIRCPGVAEVAAIGVDDLHSGEVVKLFVVRKAGSMLSEHEVIDYCRKELTSYKIPKYIEFREELPKNNVGKVLRRLLKEGKSH